jgi:AcrR family transcriptional regulator
MRLVMPPKVKYSREDVIKAAVELVEEKGQAELTARGVAGKLGSSTAPVYHYFATMDELALEVINETKKMLLDYTSRPYTERRFLNMGTGVTMFACEHSRLYRALLLEGDNYRDTIHEVLDILESEMGKDPRFESWSADDRHVLMQKMWTFTHGLASLICVGLIDQCSQEFIIDTLLDVGSDVIGATIAKQGK